MMKTLILAVLLLLMASPVMANQSREKKQVELGAACVTAFEYAKSSRSSG